jgi:Thioredoxin domain-containing protein
MKELAITFIIALVGGSIYNQMQLPSANPGSQQQGAAPTAATAGVGQELIQGVDEGMFQGYVLDAKEPVLVEFYTDQCVYCRKMAPSLGRLAYAGQGVIRVCKVNADQNSGLADRYGVTGVPALLLFQSGQLTDTLAGSQDGDQIRAWLARHDIKVAVSTSQKLNDTRSSSAQQASKS